MMSDFQLKFGCLGSCVMRLWTLFKSSVVAGCFEHRSGRERGALPHYCQVWLEVQVPHWPSLTPRVRGSLLLLAGAGIQGPHSAF